MSRRRAPDRAAQRFSSGLTVTALWGTRIADLLQGGKVVSVLCAVCGRGIRTGVPTPVRRLILHDVLLEILSGSKRTA